MVPNVANGELKFDLYFDGNKAGSSTITGTWKIASFCPARYHYNSDIDDISVYEVSRPQLTGIDAGVLGQPVPLQMSTNSYYMPIKSTDITLKFNSKLDANSMNSTKIPISIGGSQINYTGIYNESQNTYKIILPTLARTDEFTIDLSNVNCFGLKLTNNSIVLKVKPLINFTFKGVNGNITTLAQSGGKLSASVQCDNSLQNSNGGSINSLIVLSLYKMITNIQGEELGWQIVNIKAATLELQDNGTAVVDTAFADVPIDNNKYFAQVQVWDMTKGFAALCYPSEIQ